MDLVRERLVGVSGVDSTTASEFRIDTLISEMTLAEKVSLVAGADIWCLPSVERLAIPSLVMSDGPAGVRGGSFMSGRSVSFPCETALAATWDVDLVGEVGDALGREARAMGVDVLLAPTVNLHRHPLGGRNFECFSEDPLLSARMAAAYINGVQASRVACCVKHLVCNDSEFERHTISSEVDEATLREMYLIPFEEAIRSGVWAVMASYNKLNGVHTSEHPWLLDRLLRGEWGFDGVVVSDWYATHSTVDAVEAGLDVEMPGPPRFRGTALFTEVEEGRIAESTLDRSLRRVLRLIDRTAGIGGEGRTERPRLASHSLRSLVRRAGASSVVLLKNERNVLPLDPNRLATVALIGPGADIGTFQGGGSAQVNPSDVAGILPALNEAFGEGVNVVFERGCVIADWPFPLTSPMVTTPSGEPGVKVFYHLASEPDSEAVAVETARQLQLVYIGEIVAGRRNEEVMIRAAAVLHPDESGTYTLSMAGSGTLRLFVDGDLLAEGSWQVPGGMAFEIAGHSTRVAVDMQSGVARQLLVEFVPAAGKGLTRMEVTVIPPEIPGRAERAVELARSSDAVIVVAESPHGWESEGRDRTTMTLPGRQDELIAAVTQANSRTVVVVNAGAPVAMPWADQAAAIMCMWLPGQEIGGSLVDILTGSINPSGRLPTTWPKNEDDVASAPFYPGSDGRVIYGERLNFGYRHRQEATRPQPLFAFGHGLSYSSFSLGTPSITKTGTDAGASYVVSVPVAHVSGPAGREVVQVYVASGHLDGPAGQLQGFAAADLKPGETEVVDVAIPLRQLRYWNGDRWRFPVKALSVYVGTSSADLQYELELPPFTKPPTAESEDI